MSAYVHFEWKDGGLLDVSRCSHVRALDLRQVYRGAACCRHIPSIIYVREAEDLVDSRIRIGQLGAFLKLGGPCLLHCHLLRRYLLSFLQLLQVCQIHLLPNDLLAC